METLFSIALLNLIDSSGIFTRSQWSQYLLVTEAAISQWLTGKTIPKSDHLKNILLFLENFETDDVRKYLLDFYEMADKPIKETLNEDFQSRFKGVSTISDYISSSYLNSFQVEMTRMNCAVKREFIFLCTAFAKVIKNKSSDMKLSEDLWMFKSALQNIGSDKLMGLVLDSINEIKMHDFNVSPDESSPSDADREISTDHAKAVKSVYKIEDRITPGFNCEIFYLDFQKSINGKIKLPPIKANEIFLYKIKGKFNWVFDGYGKFDFLENDLGRFRMNTGVMFPPSDLEIVDDGFGFLILCEGASDTQYMERYINQLYGNSKILDLLPKVENISKDFLPFDCVLGKLPKTEFEFNKIINNEGVTKQYLFNQAYFNPFGDRFSMFLDSFVSLKFLIVSKMHLHEKVIALENSSSSEIIVPLFSSVKALTYNMQELENREALMVDSNDPNIVETEIPGIKEANNSPNIFMLRSGTYYKLLSEKDEKTVCMIIVLGSGLSDKAHGLLNYWKKDEDINAISVLPMVKEK